MVRDYQASCGDADIVVVEGKFNVLNDDPYGLYYRLTDAVSVK